MSRNDIDYFDHLKKIIDACVESVAALYEYGERARSFAEACRKVDRQAKLLKTIRTTVEDEREVS